MGAELLGRKEGRSLEAKLVAVHASALKSLKEETGKLEAEPQLSGFLAVWLQLTHRSPLNMFCVQKGNATDLP